MRTVGLAEAKAQLSALLDAVEAGDEVVITRRGHLLAKDSDSQSDNFSIDPDQLISLLHHMQLV